MRHGEPAQRKSNDPRGRVQRLRALRGILPTEVPGVGGGAKQLWCASGTVSRDGLHRLRHLLLLLPGAITVFRMKSPEQAAAQPEELMRQLCKGNVAAMKGAILAGCRAYYGYPITPASENCRGRRVVFAASGRHVCAGRKAKWQPSTWCMARHPRGCGS